MTSLQQRPPRPAATVILVRDAPQASGIQVLLLKRASSKDQTSGAWVFPGGVLEPGDLEAAASDDLSDAQASSRLGLRSGGLAYYLAAIRECSEECGIQVGTPGQLRYIAHWLTPTARPKRFDTRFFVALAPPGAVACHDGEETLGHAWVAPAEALGDPYGAHLMTPTRATLESLVRFRTAAEVMAWADRLESVPCIEPRMALGTGGIQSIAPGHPAYEEVGKLDVTGTGDAWCELRPGVAVRVSARVLRVVGDDGRNTYRVETEWGCEEVPPGALRLVEEDGVVIAPDTRDIPAEWRGRAEWLAPARGFLRKLRP